MAARPNSWLSFSLGHWTGLNSMQGRKHPLKKLRGGTPLWLRQAWLWNVEAGPPGLLKAGPWNHVMPNFSNEFSRREKPGQVKDKSCSQPGRPKETALSEAQVWNLRWPGCVSSTGTLCGRRVGPGVPWGCTPAWSLFPACSLHCPT